MQHSKITRWLATAALAATLSGAALADGPYSGLFIFGDSLSDSGNVAALVGTNPGQVISGNSYVPSQPYASGTFSNSAVWANSFAAGIGLAASALPSLGGGGNFGFGGARTATDGGGLPPSLSAQANMFLSATGGVAPAGAPYVVEGGGNDARDVLAAAAASATPGAVILAGAAAYAQDIGSIVDQLQAAGAQRIIVWDVPNLATAPAVTALGAGATFLGGQVSLAMTAALGARLAAEAGVSIFDVDGLVNGIVANPGGYASPMSPMLAVPCPAAWPAATCSGTASTHVGWPPDSGQRDAGGCGARAGSGAADAAGPAWSRGRRPAPRLKRAQTPANASALSSASSSACVL